MTTLPLLHRDILAMVPPTHRDSLGRLLAETDAALLERPGITRLTRAIRRPEAQAALVRLRPDPLFGYDHLYHVVVRYGVPYVEERPGSLDYDKHWWHRLWWDQVAEAVEGLRNGYQE